MEENLKKTQEPRVLQELNDTLNLSEEDRNKQHSTETLERRQILGTPFWTVGNEEQGYCICLGKFRISEIHKNGWEAEEALEKEKWSIILNSIAVMLENYQNQKKY